MGDGTGGFRHPDAVEDWRSREPSTLPRDAPGASVPHPSHALRSQIPIHRVWGTRIGEVACPPTLLETALGETNVKTGSLIITTCLLAASIAGEAFALDDAPSEQLVVFVAPGASPLAESFRAKHLAALSKLADELRLPLRVVDVAEGAPAGVAITPLIVYQNHRGRSIYQGRYASLDRVLNFVRTSRMSPQGREPLQRSEVPVWRKGRAIIACPLKIAPVTGHRPADYDHDAFAAKATEAVLGGFERFKAVDRIALRRTDRQFYMDFNPWRAEDGTLFVSVALYSQFHCKKPVFVQAGDAISGPWASRSGLFANAAAALEEAVADQLGSSAIGDGFDTISKSIPTVTWESLGLSLPPKPNAASGTSLADAPPLPREWRLGGDSGESDAQSTMIFQFPAPVDQYAGEVRKVWGTLRLGPDLALNGLRGTIHADPMSVTMGEKDLDKALHTGSLFLDADTYPTSRFVIESVDTHSAGARLAYGEMVQAMMHGTFTMKNVPITITVPTLFEPVVGADGKPRLVMRGGFEIPLTPFNIEGPDGPSPAAETLVFEFDLMLRLSASPKTKSEP